jgi:hypothetical protein
MGANGFAKWKDFHVTVIVDGRVQMGDDTQKWAAQNGFFDPAVMNVGGIGLDVSMHCFEYSVQLRKGAEQVLEELSNGSLTAL